ncbi:MAG: hypothetical protein RRB13_10680 [bacterium]|nr:hypothetical protein [bacterium]
MKTTYQVVYAPRWGLRKKYRQVVADGLVEACGLRWLVLESGERVEFVVNGEVRFSKERELAVQLAQEERLKQEQLAQMKGG